jgi:hypothetical protein
LVAGVSPDQVIIDRVNRRALVRAVPLPGADLASYRALEARVGAAEQGWTITLVPPAAPLPQVEFEEGEPTAKGAEALAVAAWAAQRLRLPIAASGNDSEAAAASLRRQGARVSVTEAEGAGARLTWLAPDAAEEP